MYMRITKPAVAALRTGADPARQTFAAIHAGLPTLVVAAATLMAGGVFAIVVVHMLAN